jgi:hypothetical protein
MAKFKFNGLQIVNGEWIVDMEAMGGDIPIDPPKPPPVIDPGNITVLNSDGLDKNRRTTNGDAFFPVIETRLGIIVDMNTTLTLASDTRPADWKRMRCRVVLPQDFDNGLKFQCKTTGKDDVINMAWQTYRDLSGGIIKNTGFRFYDMRNAGEYWFDVEAEFVHRKLVMDNYFGGAQDTPLDTFRVRSSTGSIKHESYIFHSNGSSYRRNSVVWVQEP